MAPGPLPVTPERTGIAAPAGTVVGIATTLAEYLSTCFAPAVGADGRRHRAILDAGRPGILEPPVDGAAISEPWEQFQRRLPAPFRRGGDGLLALTGLLDGVATGRLRRREVLGRILRSVQTLDAGAVGASLVQLLAPPHGTGALDDGPSAMEGDVIVVREDDYLWCGAVLAQQDGRRLHICDDLDALSWPQPGGACRSLTLVAEPEAFPIPRLARLLGWDGAPPCALPWGILTARSLPALSRLIVRGQLALPPRPSLSVVDADAPVRSSADHELVPWSALSRTRLEHLMSGEFAVIGLASHGDAIDAHLNHGVLCGRRSTAAPGVVGSVVHTCQVDGFCRRDVDGVKLRLPIDRLRCQLLFNETCSGIALADGLFPTELSLALSALDGAACAYLSSAKIVRTTNHGPLLVHALLRSGRTFGETAATFAAFHRSVTGDMPSYVLLGDAAGVLGGAAGRGSRPAAVRVEWEPDGRSATIHVSGVAAHAVEVPLHGDAAEALADDEPALIELMEPAADTAGGPLFVTVIPWLADVPLTLVVFACAPIHLDRLVVRLSADTQHRIQAKEVLRQLDSHLALLAHIGDKVARCDGLRDTPELRRQGHDLTAAMAMGRQASEVGTRLAQLARTGVVHSAQMPWARLRSAYDRLLLDGDRFLAEHWPAWKMTHYLAPFYAGRLRAEDRERAARDCPLCGGPCFTVTMRNETEDHLARIITCCARCGMLSDRPRGQPEMEIGGVCAADRGSPSPLTVGIGNPGNATCSFAVTMGFEGDFPWFSADIAPAHRCGMIGARGRTEEPFAVTIDPASSPGIYQLIVFCASRFGISVSTRPFLVRR
jgi:hypothetical protein